MALLRLIALVSPALWVGGFIALIDRHLFVQIAQALLP